MADFRPGAEAPADRAWRVATEVAALLVRADEAGEVRASPEALCAHVGYGTKAMLRALVNRALHALAYEGADDLKVRRAEAGADRMRAFAAFAYAARSWGRERRVVARLEATTRGFDARYIVTSLSGEPRHLYEVL